jgi:hypothetical protein
VDLEQDEGKIVLDHLQDKKLGLPPYKRRREKGRVLLIQLGVRCEVVSTCLINVDDGV